MPAVCILLFPVLYGLLLYIHKTEEVSIQEYATVQRRVNDATRPCIAASLQDGGISLWEYDYIVARYNADYGRRNRDAVIVTVREDLKNN